MRQTSRNLVALRVTVQLNASRALLLNCRVRNRAGRERAYPTAVQERKVNFDAELTQLSLGASHRRLASIHVGTPCL